MPLKQQSHLGIIEKEDRIMNCDCTSYHRHCENASKIEEIRHEHYEKARQNDEWFIESMKAIDEPRSRAPNSPPVTIYDRWDAGMYLDAAFCDDVKDVIQEQCPMCGKKYNRPLFLSESFGCGGIMYIKCPTCHHKYKWEKYSDI